uniref:Uncharacterized protein n=1 Tax=Cucumis melo TaxID=3656 RepID=A0A9I9EJ97_CUCME
MSYEGKKWKCDILNHPPGKSATELVISITKTQTEVELILEGTKAHFTCLAKGTDFNAFSISGRLSFSKVSQCTIIVSRLKSLQPLLGRFGLSSQAVADVQSSLLFSLQASLLVKLLEFLLTIVASSKLVKVVKDNLRELVYYTIAFLQIYGATGALLLKEIVGNCGLDGINVIIDAAKSRFNDSKVLKGNFFQFFDPIILYRKSHNSFYLILFVKLQIFIIQVAALVNGASSTLGFTLKGGGRKPWNTNGEDNNDSENHNNSCNYGQVTGKAIMFNEIINYVQSLQRQVKVAALEVGRKLHYFKERMIEVIRLKAKQLCR